MIQSITSILTTTRFDDLYLTSNRSQNMLVMLSNGNITYADPMITDTNMSSNNSDNDTRTDFKHISRDDRKYHEVDLDGDFTHAGANVTNIKDAHASASYARNKIGGSAGAHLGDNIGYILPDSSSPGAVPEHYKYMQDENFPLGPSKPRPSASGPGCGVLSGAASYSYMDEDTFPFGPSRSGTNQSSPSAPKYNVPSTSAQSGYGRSSHHAGRHGANPASYGAYAPRSSFPPTHNSSNPVGTAPGGRHPYEDQGSRLNESAGTASTTSPASTSKRVFGTVKKATIGNDTFENMKQEDHSVMTVGDNHSGYPPDFWDLDTGDDASWQHI